MGEKECKGCDTCAFQLYEIDEYPCSKCRNNMTPDDPRYPTSELCWRGCGEEANSVNHPSHYNQGNIECIDAMVAAFGAEPVAIFCHLNAFKYVWRMENKNGREDTDKAIWYLNKYKELKGCD